MTEETKKKNGRPTKLNQAMVDSAYAYLAESAKDWKVYSEPREIEVIKKVDEDQANDFPTLEESVSKSEKKGPKMFKTIMVDVLKRPRLVNHARLAVNLQVVKSTMYEWSKPHDEDDEEMIKLRESFSNCLGQIANLQETMLVEYGADGKYNSAVANRILAACHDYKDRTDVTTNGKELNSEPTELTPDQAKKVAAFQESLRPKRK